MRLSLTLKSKLLAARRTRERERILDRVQVLRHHFGAEELWLSLMRRGERVSRATVYRTLEMLVDRGVLQRVQLDELGSKYEVIAGRPPHAHLYCLRCGKLLDYRVPGLAGLPERARREKGFEPVHLLMRICGYCKSCVTKRRASNGPKIKSRRKGGRRQWEK